MDEFVVDDGIDVVTQEVTTSENNEDHLYNELNTGLTEKSASTNSEPGTSAKNKAARNKSRKRKHSTSSEKSSNESESSNDEKDEKEENQPHDFKRFRALPYEDRFKWYLSKDLADYANKYMSEFIPDKDISDNIFYENPIPSNVGNPRKLDDFIKELLGERKQMSELTFDSRMERVQQKIVNVYAPLSKVWKSVDDFKNGNRNDGMEIDSVLSLLDQTVMLVGQAFNSVSYYRRFNALQAITKDPRKTKKMLKEKNTVLIQEQEKFGFWRKVPISYIKNC